MKKYFLPAMAVPVILLAVLAINKQKATSSSSAVGNEATPQIVDNPANRYEEGGIKWMTFEEAVKANQSQKRKVFIDVYTDWCGWCKVMDKKTFTDQTVIDYMNEHYYAVKFNAEKGNPVSFQGKNFELVDGGGNRSIHTLAYALLDGKLSYPSYVYLNENNQRITVSKGFKDPVRFLAELKSMESGAGGI